MIYHAVPWQWQSEQARGTPTTFKVLVLAGNQQWSCIGAIMVEFFSVSTCRLQKQPFLLKPRCLSSRNFRPFKSSISITTHCALKTSVFDGAPMAWTKHRSGKAWLRHLKPLPAVALTKLGAVLTELLPCFVLESRSLSLLGMSVIANVPGRHGTPWDAGVS